jgi:hypothetical protein
MAHFLVSHELDQKLVISRNAFFRKIFCGKLCKAMMKEVELNPFLVQCQVLHESMNKRSKEIMMKHTKDWKSKSLAGR